MRWWGRNADEQKDQMEWSGQGKPGWSGALNGNPWIQLLKFKALEAADAPE